jgi:hypothetical protein
MFAAAPLVNGKKAETERKIKSGVYILDDLN